MTLRKRMAGRGLSLLACGLLLFLSACDATDPGLQTVTLRFEVTESASGEDIIFNFDSASFPTGRLEDVACGCTVDAADFLTAQGFSKGEIVSASVESARLVMLFPISEQLGFLNQAILKFEASGLSATEVANRSDFPAAREATLSVLSGRDVAGFLTRNNFSMLLQIDAETLRPNEDYEISLVLTLRIEVEGF